LILKVKKYLPLASHDLVSDFMTQNAFELHIKNIRKTKHGDFRTASNGIYKISINKDFNQYRFLITFIHEMAHLVTFKKFGRVKPHGTTWKKTFKQLMLPYLNDEIFPSDVLSPLANYIINAKARTDADLKLSLALRRYDEVTDKKLIFELDLGTLFQHQNRVFKRGEKRKTRYVCTEVQTKRTYLFQQNAEVFLIV